MMLAGSEQFKITHFTIKLAPFQTVAGLCEAGRGHSVCCSRPLRGRPGAQTPADRKSTRLNSSHANISYAVFCLKKKKKNRISSSAGGAHASTVNCPNRQAPHIAFRNHRTQLTNITSLSDA